MIISQDLDLSFLFDIADGSNEFIVDSIEMFLQQTPELLNNMTKAIAAGEWKAAGAAAHKLKPNLGFFGMLEAQATIQDVELLCKAGGQDQPVIHAKFNQVKSVLTNNMIKLAKVMKEKEALL